VLGSSALRYTCRPTLARALLHPDAAIPRVYGRARARTPVQTDFMMQLLVVSQNDSLLPAAVGSWVREKRPDRRRTPSAKLASGEPDQDATHGTQLAAPRHF
jgi:hypothetical protein